MMRRDLQARRRGAIIPMAALLSVIILGMVAFAVDIGWVAVSQAELQNAADSAAYAGAYPLMNGYVQYQLASDATTKSNVMSTALARARTYAIKYAGYNAAGGVSSLTLNTSDIEFGYTDSSNKYTAQPTYTGFPNTIKVVMRRDGTANQALSLYFGKVLGTSSVNLNATASATIYTGTINSLTKSSYNSTFLPVTYDVNNWNNFLATGQDPDGNITKDANGVPELKIYPSVKSSGNFGQLSLDDSHNGDSTETGWVNNGISSSDIQSLLNNNLVPLSSHDSTKWDWQGDTGMKASLISAINGKQGQTFILPLFNPYNSSSSNYQAGTGQGSNYDYQIVQFVGVTIMPSPDSNGQVIVQPAAITDPNAVYTSSTVVPAGSGNSTTLVTTFTPPKLTR